MRTLRYLSDKYGDKIGLSKFLKKNKRSLIYDILSGLKPLVTRPIKAGAKGTRMNLTDVIDSIEEEYLQEDGENRLGIIGSGIDATNEGIDSAKEAFDTSIDYGKQGIEGAKKLGLLTPKEKALKVKEKVYKDYASKIGLKFKKEVSFVGAKPIVKKIMNDTKAAYSKYGVTPLITSGTEFVKERKGKSHTRGVGMDFSVSNLSKDLATRKKQELAIQKSLQKKYRVEFHDAGTGHHLHVQER